MNTILLKALEDPWYYDMFIVLTFDDGYRDHFYIAKNIMDRYGFKGVEFVVIKWLRDYSNNDMFLSISELNEMDRDGWDISSHTLSHPRLTEIDRNSVVYELLESRRWLDEHGFSKGAKFFASPYGAYNDEVIKEIQRFYVMHRTVDEGINTLRALDLYRLKSVLTPLASSWFGWKEYLKWFESSYTHIDDKIVIITIHRIDPEVFRELCDYINNMVLSGRAKVVTFSDLYDDILKNRMI